MLDALKTRLQPWLAERLNARDLVVQTFEPLGGGSIQENWRLRCMSPDGVAREFVLRKDAPATIASSRTRREEYAIMEAAHEAGVLTPEPVGFYADADVIGAPFAVMSMVPGVGLGPRIVKDHSLGGDRTELAKRLGRELAKIHAVRPPREALAFLGQPPENPALAEIRILRAILDGLADLRPAIEWGLRWAELRAPPCPIPTLVHRDYRTGNYMSTPTG
jgi:aminoglycoside phosphotransferase (APT) family kinase protein